MTIWETIRGAFGVGGGVSPTVELAQRIYSNGLVVQPLPLSNQFTRIGGGLTPLQVSNIIRDADTGRPARFIDLLNEARQKDCHLQSVLGTREGAVPKLKWQCKAPVVGKRKGSREGATRLRDRKAAEFCTSALRQAVVMDRPDNNVCGFPDLLAHLVGGGYYGFAVGETVWRKDRGKLVPSGWSRCAPRRFVFDDDTGALRWYDEMTMPYAGVDFMSQFPGRFVVHQPRINGDVPVREGYGRVLMWAAMFRNWTIKDWMTLAELAWKPWRTGMYKRGATETDIDNLIEILDGMSASGVCVYPEDAQVKVEWPKGAITGNSAHGELAAFMAAEMSKAVLGQTLTTEQGKNGARSLGEVHDSVRKDIIEADAKSVASTIRRHLIVPMVRMNFGSDVAIPEFEFITQDPVDLKAFSESVERLSGAGLRIPSKWVRDQAGIPEPEEGEECIGGAEAEDAEDETDPPDGEDEVEDDEPVKDAA